jgi:hypothetical protein
MFEPMSRWMKLKSYIKRIPRYLAEGLVGSFLWIVFLTPYIFLVVKSIMEQYFWWLVMEFVLVLPLAPIIYRSTSYLKKKLKI